MSTPESDHEDTPQTIDNDSLAVLKLVTASFRTRGATPSILGAGNDLFINNWEEDGAFNGLEDEDSIANQPVAAILELPNGSHKFDSSLCAFMLGPDVKLSGKRAHKLLGGFVFYSEPRDCGVGTHSGILIYKDNKVKVEHHPWAIEENVDESHTKLFEALQEITDEITVEPYTTELQMFSTGWGLAAKFYEMWPTIFDAATNLP